MDSVMYGTCSQCGGPLVNGHQCPEWRKEVAKLAVATARGEAETMKPSNYGPFYAAGLYPKLADVFRSYGYALAVHGSVASDFDLIAVPWTEDAVDPQIVVDECMRRFSFKKVPDGYRGEQKPHGRLAFRIPFSFDACSMDVSFMPRQPQPGAEK